MLSFFFLRAILFFPPRGISIFGDSHKKHRTHRSDDDHELNILMNGIRARPEWQSDPAVRRIHILMTEKGSLQAFNCVLSHYGTEAISFVWTWRLVLVFLHTFTSVGAQTLRYFDFLWWTDLWHNVDRFWTDDLSLLWRAWRHWGADSDSLPPIH